ncbi:MAG: TlpA family protein disulfide reductase [Helicobacteraceae bacterium]|nr:TlpA family protein disulfide reductase [Helicobacteraceae bacterium]
MKKIIIMMAISVALFAGMKSGDKAVDFELPTLDQSKTYTMKEFRGQVVLLNLWASWCSGCKKEMPEFFKLQKAYPEGFKLVTISLDSQAEESNDYLVAIEELIGYKTPFITLYDAKKEIAKAYGARAMPSSFLIDKNAIIRKVIIGSLDEEDIDELKKDINSLMK